jgi:hypothetical protein
MLTYVQDPKFTFSRKSRRTVALTNDVLENKIGIGWSNNGIAKFNDFYDMVVEDRVSRGAVFNNELLNVFRERRNKRNSKPTCVPDAKRQKLMPKDDMEPFDTLHVNLFASGTVSEDRAFMHV